MGRRLDNDQIFMKLEQIATNSRAYKNANRFSKILQTAIRGGYPIDYKLSPEYIKQARSYSQIFANYLDGKTLLHLVIGNGCGEVHQIIDELLKAGADPNITRNDGANALIIAAQNRRSAVILSKLSRRITDINHMRTTPEYLERRTAIGEICRKYIKGWLTWENTCDCMKILLDAGADLNVDGTLDMLKTELKNSVNKNNTKHLIEFKNPYIKKKKKKQELHQNVYTGYEYEL